MRRLLVGVAVVTSLTIVGIPAAMATPTGGYAVFAQCPTKAAGVDGCIYSPTESGEITLGKQTVPIVNTQVLQGGLLEETEPFVKQLAPAVNGETLTKTAQRVPGGLLGVKCYEIKGEGHIEKELRKACEKIFEEGFLGVSAVTELAAPASSVVLNTFSEATGLGTALTLPIKIKLENALFGSKCYIGSNSDPIMLDLITGTTSPPAPNTPITGSPGTKSSKEEGGILVLSGVKLVDNSFSAPGATGCGLLGLLDGLINAKLGLPSAEGHNTAILNGKVELANSELVEESEG